MSGSAVFRHFSFASLNNPGPLKFLNDGKLGSLAMDARAKARDIQVLRSRHDALVTDHFLYI